MTHLPADSGMAFVLVQHLDLKHHSMLTEFLSKKTAMRVTEVIDGMKVERDHVWVTPPNATMSISNHTLLLRAREESRGLRVRRCAEKGIAPLGCQNAPRVFEFAEHSAHLGDLF
jgi:chemotaxis response regulator CheB